jgi:hypothetical protein
MTAGRVSAGCFVLTLDPGGARPPISGTALDQQRLRDETRLRLETAIRRARAAVALATEAALQAQQTVARNALLRKDIRRQRASRNYGRASAGPLAGGTEYQH